MLCSALISILLIVMISMPNNGFLNFMELMTLPNSARIFIIEIVSLNSIISILAERYLWQRIITLFIKNKN